MKILELLIVIILLFLLTLIGNPFMFWMPSMVMVSSLVIIAALVFTWACFMVSETASDEREELHRSHASRAAYLSAAAVLTLALIYQGLTNHIDFWIPLTLAVMILAKLITRFYVDTYR